MTTDVEHTDTEGPRVDAPALVAALGVPLLAGAAILMADAAWADRLPDQVATHWNAAGQPDDFGERARSVATMAATTVILPVALGLVAGVARVWAPLRRTMLGAGAATAVLLGGMGVYGLAVQRDGRPGTMSVAVVLGFAAAGAAVGLLLSRVPRDRMPRVLATARPAPRLPRSPARTVPEHRVGAGGRLSVEDDVVRVRWLGRTVVRIPVEEVASARPITLSAVGEFGGWGLRMAPGGRRYGFIGSGTTAVELTKADGSRWVVTTDRAEEVAGVVNAAADRMRPAGGG